MSRTHVRRRIFAAAVLVGALTLGGQAASALGGSGARGSAIHVVQPGETLWSIAQGSAPGRDPRPLIQAIEDNNGVSAAELVPGLSLRIPLDA